MVFHHRGTERLGVAQRSFLGALTSIVARYPYFCDCHVCIEDTGADAHIGASCRRIQKI